MNKQILTIITCLVIAVNVNAQSTANKGGKGKGGETGIGLGGGINYYITTGNQKNNINPFLFLKNAQSIGANFLLTTQKREVGFKFNIEYFTGINDKDAPAVYAKEKDIIYTKYNFSKAKPAGLILMTGPRFILFPKSKLPRIYLELKAGAIFSNNQSLQYFNGQNALSREIKSNAASFAYSPGITIIPLSIKRTDFTINAGYSNFGGFNIGIGIALKNCAGVPCGFKGCDCCFCTGTGVSENQSK